MSNSHSVRVTVSIAVLLWAGCSSSKTPEVVSDRSIYVVEEVDVNLGNIMYIGDEDGHYDIWYTGVKLNNGHSTITITHHGGEENENILTNLRVGDRVKITTKLGDVRTKPFNAHWLADIQLERFGEK